ncbi:hypothetical protein [Cohnella faecalis]|uniref:hypothetical protein n=1 Tax=Cohnella faecalis TaxID=2315694 RepID=UPI0011C23EB0|nr:hypothetical protein [Cohnella faecalis]
MACKTPPKPEACTPAVQRRRSGPGAALYPLGRGTFERWSIDIVGSIVALQQGSGPVYDDGASAPDGSIPVQDGLLKADDRCAMDWEYDRLTTATGMKILRLSVCGLVADRIDPASDLDHAVEG